MLDIAHVLSNVTNPALAIVLLIATIRQRVYNPWLFIVTASVAIGYSVWIAEMGKDVLLYPHPGGFPSGHETFAAACLTCLVWLNRRWIAFAIPAGAVMGIAIVVARYHAPVDVVGAAIISPLTTSAVIFVCLRSAQRIGATA